MRRPLRPRQASKRVSPARLGTTRPIARRKAVRVVLPARGCPPGAIESMQQAYLLVLREVHNEIAGQPIVQDAAGKVQKGWLARALAWVTKATSTIKSSVDEDLHTLPTVAGARLAGTQELVQQFRTRNVNLIKTVAAEHVATVDRIVRENSGTHVKGLTAKLQETLQVSESKAKFWAVDQTLKLHADIVQTQHARLGIEEYDWKTSEDGTVRDDHDKLKNKRYRYDNPPVTNASEVAKGRPARHCNPGKDYRCRCHADPVLPTAESLRAKKQVVAPVQQQPAPAPQSAPRPVPHPAQAKTQVRELFQSVQATVPQQTVDRIVGGLNSKDAAILRANPATELRMGSTLAEGKNYSGMYDQPTDTIFIKADHAIEEFPSFRGKFRPGKSWSVAVAQANPEAAAAASLTHEIAHRIQHQAKGSAVNLEVAKAFRNGKAIGNPITNYAKTNSQEYFAETYSAYRYYPDALLRHDPLGYQMIVNVLRILELA